MEKEEDTDEVNMNVWCKQTTLWRQHENVRASIAKTTNKQHKFSIYVLISNSTAVTLHVGAYGIHFTALLFLFILLYPIKKTLICYISLSREINLN